MAQTRRRKRCVSSVVRDGSEKTAVHAGRLNFQVLDPIFPPSFFLSFSASFFLSFYPFFFFFSFSQTNTITPDQSRTNLRVGVGIGGRVKKQSKYKCDATGSELDTKTLNSFLFAKKKTLQ
jgi:hypothetical protein